MQSNEWRDICILCEENGLSTIELGLSESMSFEKALPIIYSYIQKKMLSQIMRVLQELAEKHNRNLMTLIEEEKIYKDNFDNLNIEPDENTEYTQPRRRMRR